MPGTRKKAGALGGNRTHDPLLRRQLLYPTELRAQPSVEQIFARFRSKGQALSALRSRLHRNALADKKCAMAYVCKICRQLVQKEPHQCPGKEVASCDQSG